MGMGKISAGTAHSIRDFNLDIGRQRTDDSRLPVQELAEFPITAATTEIVTAAFGTSMIASTYEQRVKITKVIEILRNSTPFMQSVEIGLFNLETGLKFKVSIIRE